MTVQLAESLIETIKLNPESTAGEIAQSYGCTAKRVYTIVRRNNLRLRTLGKGESSGAGVSCPKCGGTLNGVCDSRPHVLDGMKCISRTRKCECGVRFGTIEVTTDTFAAFEENNKRKLVASIIDQMGFSAKEILDLLIDARADK